MNPELDTLDQPPGINIALIPAQSGCPAIPELVLEVIVTPGHELKTDWEKAEEVQNNASSVKV